MHVPERLGGQTLVAERLEDACHLRAAAYQADASAPRAHGAQRRQIMLVAAGDAIAMKAGWASGARSRPIGIESTATSSAAGKRSAFANFSRSSTT